MTHLFIPPQCDILKIVTHPLILPFYVPSLILAFSLGMLIPVLPLYILEFDSSLWLVGIVLSGLPLGMICGDLPTGKFLRYLGQKRTMQAGFFGFCLANGAMYFAGSVVGVLICQFFSGFSVALISVSRHAYVSDQTHGSQRGRVIAIFGGLNRLGKFIGPLAGGSLAALSDLSFVFLGASAACFIGFVIVTFSIHTSVKQNETQPSTQPHASLLTIMRRNARTLLTAGTGQLFAQTIRAARPVIIPLFGAEVIGLGVAEIGVIISASAAFDMSLFYFAGWLMDTWGRKYAIIPSFAIQTAAFTMIPLCSGFSSLMLVSCLIGIGNGIGSGNMTTLGSDLAPPGERGEFLGIWRLIGDSGQLSAPMLVGNIAELMTLHASAMAVSGVGFLAVLFFAFLIPETLVKKESR